jgi:uncharacterized protein with ATP-grasp and redox domains
VQLFLDCLPCLLRQALEAARMASDDEAVQGRIMDEATLTLSRHRDFRSAPAIAQTMHEAVKCQTGLTDPYREIKDRDLAAALRLEPALTRFVEAAPDRLLAALKVSATGNVMDSALYLDLDIETCVTPELERPFATSDLDPFVDELRHATTILVIGDNAGEAVFDKILARELASHHDVTFAVRARPIINDVTIEDALSVGIDRYANVVSTGCAAPGLIVEDCSEDFLAVFDRADLVISKGQGNFEALSEVPRRVYFLLKAKCPKVARALNVDVGDYVLRAKSARSYIPGSVD